MSARSLAKHALSALNSEKPHSSITDWVEILTADSVQDEAYDGIPELVDAINLQPTGPAEASRALRKKLKHGSSHRQYRALVILKALVENGGPKFQGGFADSQLTDAIRQLAGDSTLDPKVRRKLNLVLASWYRQFKDDPKMAAVASLYKTTRDPAGLTLYEGSDSVRAYQAAQREQQAKRDKERLEEKEKLKREKEEAKRKKAAQKAKPQNRSNRRPFNFEEEKPKVLAALVEASQASNNLLNAMQHVNREQESVQTNAKVQECLSRLKQIRKIIVRYVQLVENEQFIGTLIDTNERVISAMETYDNIVAAEQTATGETVGDPQPIRPNNTGDSELGKLQAKQRDRVARSIHRDRGDSNAVHPDLEDLSFGTLGASNSALPPPLRPTAPGADSDGEYDRPSLSDYSDYDTSEEEDYSSQRHSQVGSAQSSRRNTQEEEDPFADPFADQNEVSTPGINEKKLINW